MTPFHIVLHSPVIPQNTGSIARLCAGSGSGLHLIHPLGFDTSAAMVKRAGLDYWEHVSMKEHASWESFVREERPPNLYLFSKLATRSYVSASFQTPCYLVLGSETKGLPSEFHTRYQDHFFSIPIRTHLVRSLNLAQCAAIVLYEALRQNGFPALLR